MPTFTRYQPFLAAAMNLTHDLSGATPHVFKLFFTDTAPNAAHATLSQVSAVSVANLDSVTLTITSSTQTSGTYKWVVATKVCTASGAVGPFRYIGIYNDTATDDPVVGYWDHGSEITMAATDTYTATFSGANGVFQIG